MEFVCSALAPAPGSTLFPYTTLFRSPAVGLPQPGRRPSGRPGMVHPGARGPALVPPARLLRRRDGSLGPRAREDRKSVVEGKGVDCGRAGLTVQPQR